MKSQKTLKTVLNSKPEVVPYFTAIFILGLKFSQLLSLDLSILMFFMASGCIVLSFFFSKNLRFLLAVLALGAFCSGFFYGNLRIEPEFNSGELRLFDGSSGTLSGTFSGEYHVLKYGDISFMLKDCKFDTASQTVSIPTTIYCRIKNPDVLPEPEQQYSLSGKLNFNPGQRFPSFSAATITQKAFQNPLNSIGGKIQRQIRDNLNMVLPTRHAAIVIGFLLGDTSGIDKKDKKLFRETGISHLLAVSGQHIMILTLVIAACLHLLRVPPVSRTIMIGLFLLLYAFSTSGSPSIFRALIMYLVTATIYHLEATPTPIRPVSLAALILLLYDPALISDPAFILSFSAVLGLVFLRPMFEYYFKRIKLPDLLARYFSVSIAANLGVMPMAAYLFGTVSLISFMVNPAIIWLFAVILPLSFFIAVVSLLSTNYGLFIAPGLSIPLDGFLLFLEKAHAEPGGFFCVGTLPGLLAAAIYTIVLLWVGVWNRRMILKNTASDSEKVSTSIKQIEVTAGLQSEIRNLSANTRQTTSRQSAGKSAGLVVKSSGMDLRNHFKDNSFLRLADAMMLSSKRRSLKNIYEYSTDFPVNLLGIDSQNLYYRIIDIDRSVIANEKDRLIQAQVFVMALAGSEIINRISFHLNPPPDPSEIAVDMVIRDRYLASAVLGDRVLCSSMLTRTANDNFILLMTRGRSLFSRGKSQLSRFMNLQNEEMIEQHFSYRRDLFAWCRDFIEFDLECRKASQ
ncbi:MAG: hypothetical protein Kow0029_26170 [Candidatus Rifleibacteriota bacterium]